MAISVEKIKNLTKSEDNGHAHKYSWLFQRKKIENLTKSYDNGHAHKYSRPFQRIKFRILQKNTNSYDNGHQQMFMAISFQWINSEFNKIIQNHMIMVMDTNVHGHFN